MQVKPRFESFKILRQIPVCTDDTGNVMCLTLMEAKIHSNEYEISHTPYQFWVVIGKTQEQYSNKAIGYSSVAYWKAKQKDLISIEIEGILIQEVMDGGHYMFTVQNTECIKLQNESDSQYKERREKLNEETGLRTVFKIKITEGEK